MVAGLEIFKNYFKGFEQCYLIIGGTACDIVIQKRGFYPRATQDIDIILIIEALTPEFVEQFWKFITDGYYGVKQKDLLNRNCYRFRNPEKADYPLQIELFSKTPDAISLQNEAHLTPIPTDEGLSHLSAILLNNDYYDFTIAHSSFIDNVHYANTEALICLKAFACLDNKKRKETGQPIRTREVVKHKNDVFRMVFMLNPDDRFNLPVKIKDDLQCFADAVKNDLPPPEIFRMNGFGRQSMQTIYTNFIKIFGLNPD
jgi:hypothetical protein